MIFRRSQNDARRGRAWRYLLYGVVLIASLLAALAYSFYPRVAPVSGKFKVAQLGNKVAIYFDEYQRPYVQAQTLDDTLFAEGWLHASNRFWQMELFRRAGKGRLAQLLGSSLLESDKELWRMGVPQLARALEENASAEMISHVEAYVNGINAALASDTFSPPELLLLQQPPEPWKSGDVFAMGALMAYQSANNSENELLRLALADELGESAASAFVPRDGTQPEFPYVMPASWTVAGEKLTHLLQRRSATDPLDQLLFPSFAFGSNGWVVSPQRSATGHALFAFDSHDDLGLPNLFYEVHLFFGDGRQIRGWSVPGLPGVINGFNERIAWGFTNIGDTQDLFLETRSDTNPLQFKQGDSWYEARTEVVEIPVAGRDQAESLTLTYTKNGPLISEDPPIALRWSVQDLDGMSIDSILEFNLARSWDEFNRAMDRFAAPALNATYADIDGNIGFRTAGRIPLRGKGSGLYPQNGDDPASQWRGYVAPTDLPRLYNPESGYAAAANARVNASGQGPLISEDNAPAYRIRRIQEVLGKRSDFTVDDMRRLQLDWFDGQAALLMPVLMASLHGANLSPTEAQAHEALVAWQGNWEAVPDGAAPIIFQAWYRALAVEVFRPAMSDALFAQVIKSNYPLNHALDQLVLEDHDSTWWRGDRTGLTQKAFSAAVAEIADIQGADASTWRLDHMHRVKLEHELGKAVPQLGWLLNAPLAPWGGSTATVGRARYRYDRPYDVTSAATVRVVGEMSPTGPHMQAIMPGGQSGHPLSPHYLDQLPLWLEGKQLPIAQSLSGLAAASSLTLEPNR